MEPRDDSYRGKYEAAVLAPGEVVEQVWPAARYENELKSAGGNLVLTNQRLIFEPLKTALPVSILSKIFGHGPTAPVGEAIGELGKWELLHLWSSPLGDVSDAESVASDRLRVHFRSGESIVFRIAAGRWVPRWQTARNSQARDAVLGQLRAAIVATPSGKA
jgi:hypothetical protein